MSTRKELAVRYFLEGRNCAQSVMLAYGDITGLDERQCAMISAGLGGGLSRLRETCGAFSVCAVLAPALMGEGADLPQNRPALYAYVQQMAGEFRDAMGSISCAELLGIRKGPQKPEPEARTAEYYAKRPCVRAIEAAADILDRRLEQTK